MIGTREISGSAAMRLRNFTIVASPSTKASSTLMSITVAPDSTCWRAMARQVSQSPALMALANFGEPVMLVRSPTTRKLEALQDMGEEAKGVRLEARGRSGSGRWTIWTAWTKWTRNRRRGSGAEVG